MHFDVTLHPYLISVCRARSSAFFMVSAGVVIVRKAARLAVYEEIIIRVNSHHDIAIILVEGALGIISQPVQNSNLLKEAKELFDQSHSSYHDSINQPSLPIKEQLLCLLICSVRRC